MSEPGSSSGLLRSLSLVVRATAALLVLAVAVGITVLLVVTRAQPKHRDRVDRVIAVRAVRAEAVPVARVWDGYGTARAMRAADVSAQVAARVVERPEGIEAGVRVEAGDVLVQLDPVDFEQRVAASTQMISSWEAQLANLDVEGRRLSDQVELGQEEVRLDERELERVRSAAEQRGANAVEVERRQSALNRMRREIAALQQQLESVGPRRAQLQAMVGAERAALRIAQENLARAAIRSPITGYLQDMWADRGEMLAVGAPVARVVDLSRIEVPLRLPVSASASLAVGDGVELWPDSPGTGSAVPARWTGRVNRIAPEADAGTRTVTVFAEVVQDASSPVLQRGNLLLPGQFVVARVVASTTEPRIVVPRRAVTSGGIMIAEPTSGTAFRARPSPVRVLFHMAARFPALDPDETEWAVLDDGVPAGAAVITTNLDEIASGTAVRLDGSRAVAADGGAPGGGVGGGPP